MKLTTVKIASLGLVLGAATLPAQAEWLNYVVRTSGLAWSDGYHAYDQCPPCQKHGHWPIKHSFVLPGYPSSSGPHSPYYFEEQAQPAVSPTPAAEPLPNAPAERSNLLLADPQARYRPRNRYFEALRGESQGTLPSQADTQQARRPANLPPF